MNEIIDEPFENQLQEVKHLSSKELKLTTPPETARPKLTRKETKTAIKHAMENGDIPFDQGIQLLKTLGFVKQNNKKVVDNKKRKMKRKMKKITRKNNRRK